MTVQKTVLTDVANGVWLEDFSLASKEGPALRGSQSWSLAKRTLHGGVSEGVDVVEIDNGALSLSILPTRGMGLWRGRFRGVDLGWRSPVDQPVNPAFVNATERSGLGWLTGFNELMCRCGLASNGAPGTDVIRSNTGSTIETDLTLHGKIANLPAHYVEAAVDSDGDGTLSVTGMVDETMLFGPCLRLTSTVQTAAGSNRLTIIDRVTNLAGQPAEMQLLYHTNLGPPLLEAGAWFLAPARQVAPRDLHAARDIGKWTSFLGPTAGYREQCYFVLPAADSRGRSVILLRNAAGDKGLSLEFRPEQLPCVTLWKNTQAEADGYVTGLEPATNFPNLRTFERQQGRVVLLKPGESYEIVLELAVHASAAEVANVERRIAEIQGGDPPQVHRQPHGNFSSA